ncbi:MAG: hypothetical protein C5B53_13520 [Candidatus Melainabacteria bacterium]|nr:MAG: hypothetical protein C5B53_13520 [Candidatus Melainabacteria bacterium]
MSQSQVTLPALTEEENTVVDRFVERSQEIVPGVEVTLAKRILRPGSNRIVCLAARTSVPINDDEMASVSDLALRLSDGTNVRLSLSFFNDAVRETITETVHETVNETVSGGAPFNRYTYTYDPKRYSVRNDSKLGTVLFGMFLIALAGAYSFTNNPFNKYIQLSKYIPATNTASNIVLPPGAPPLKTEQAGPPQKTAFVGPVRPVARIAMLHPVRASFRVPSFHTHWFRERHSAGKMRATASPQLKNEEMLVPPPPAIPVAPYELPEQFLKQISELSLPGKMVKLPGKVESKARPIAKTDPGSKAKQSETDVQSKAGALSKTPATTKTAVQGKVPQPTNTAVQSKASVPIKTAAPTNTVVPINPTAEARAARPAQVQESVQVKQEPAATTRPHPTVQTTSDFAYKNVTAEPELERIPAFDVPAHSSAPVPGNVWTSPSLERIAPTSR